MANFTVHVHGVARGYGEKRVQAVIELEIDVTKLARDVARKVVGSKSRKIKRCHGAIVIRASQIRECE